MKMLQKYGNISFKELTKKEESRKMHKIYNPILEGFYPDPAVIVVDDYYYMVNSTFVYFPCLTISRSKDLQNWEIVGHAVTESAYIDMSVYDPGRGFWAPDISYTNGRYYITATLRGNDGDALEHRQMIVWSERPEGPYSKPVFIDEPGIDPSLFHDDDGKHYMLLNPSVKIIPLTDDCLHQAGPARLLYEGWNKRKTEGPHMLKKDGWYYLFMAEGGTGDGHMISVARARSLNDEFEPCPHNPLLTQTDKSAVLQRTGHGMPFKSPQGDWFIAYLCARKRGGNYSLLGRETSLATLSWDKEGWPVINDGKGALTEIEIPDNYPTPMKKSESKTFDLSKPLTLDFLSSNGFLLARQLYIDNVTTLTLHPDKASDEAFGLMYHYDINSYIKFGVHKRNGKTELTVKVMNRTKSDEEMLMGLANIETVPSDLTLKINTRGLSKEFIYVKDGVETAVCVIKDCSFLTDEGLSMGKRFTGPTYGIFGFEDSKEAFAELTHRKLQPLPSDL